MPRLRRLLTPATFFRILLLCICIQAVDHLQSEKPPWKSAWGRHRAEGVFPSFREHLATGLWAGAVARLALGSTLLLVSLAWGAGSAAAEAEVTRQPLRMEAPIKQSVGSPMLYYGLLGALLVGALAMRLPRMNHSFWGDEEDAMATYVHGMYKPKKTKDRQGHVYFESPIWPQTFFSARHGPNNHVLFSVSSRLSLEAWRKITDRKKTEFAEWVARLPSLLAGMVSLAGVALLMRRWGVPWLGLLAVLIMALHPWHVRYSVEARGYALALAFYPFLLLALTNALDTARWRSWLAFGTFQFFIMYSWAGAAYLLAGLNVVALVLLLRSSARLPQGVRWLTINLASALVFISLYAPHVPQIMEAKQRLMWLKGLPMDAVWFHNLLAEVFTGIPYHSGPVPNPGEISWETLWISHPVLTAAGFGLAIVCFFLGLVGIWHHHRRQAWLLYSAVIAAIGCTLHFKFGIGDELRSWYLIFMLPAWSIIVAFGLRMLASIVAALGNYLPPLPRPAGMPASAIITIACALLMVASWAKMNWSLMHVPFEDFRGVMAASRDRHESFAEKVQAKVHMCWLWRYSTIYDPRGDPHVRTGEILRARMEGIKAQDGHLYVVVGFRALAQSLNSDVIAMVEDAALFEKVASFPSRNSIQMMEVYKMK